MKVCVGIAALLAVICAQTGDAQFRERLGNPTVAVNVEHPPDINLLIDRLAFGPVRGECADEIRRILVRDLVSNGLDVADGASLYHRFARYDFDYGGRIDTSAAMEVGRRLGPSMMVALDVRRCATQTEFSEEEERSTVTKADGQTEEVSETLYRLRAQAFLDLAVLTIDLTTGRELRDRTLRYSSPQEDYSSKGDYPNAPYPLDLLEEKLDEAAAEIRRMFLPRTEEIKVVYYDDRDCGLRDSYRALRRGNIDQALDLSERSLATCRATPNVEDKLMARAHYNIGILRLLRGEYDAALEFLHAAEQLRPREIMREGVATARKAKELAATMDNLQRRTPVARGDWDYRDRDDRRRETRAWEDRGLGRPAGDETLRNADVIRMVDEGVSTLIILSKVRTSSHDFDTSTPAIVALARAGVDEEIIKAMLLAD